MNSLLEHLGSLENSQIGVRLIGEPKARTLQVVKAHSDYVELSGLFDADENYAMGKIKKIRVPYAAIAWLE
jgi:hypothetical protein